MVTKFDIERECDRQLFNDFLGHMNGLFYVLKLHWLLQILINALGSLILSHIVLAVLKREWVLHSDSVFLH